MTLFAEVDAVRRRWDVLEHPFYLRWSDGQLTSEELALYAGQYRHAVVALAEGSAAAARRAEGEAGRTLEAHAAEETEHVEIWDRFASAVGASVTAAPTAETERCVRAWSGSQQRELLASLVILYAIESCQPRISEVKRAGLVEHYGFDADDPAAEYFRLHAERDIEHAREAREALADAPPVLTAELVAVAERALEANWRLLDGVERAA